MDSVVVRLRRRLVPVVDLVRRGIEGNFMVKRKNRVDRESRDDYRV